MTYLLLLLAIGVEVAATSLLPRTAGFTVLLPTVGVLTGYAVSILVLPISGVLLLDLGGASH